MRRLSFALALLLGASTAQASGLFGPFVSDSATTTATGSATARSFATRFAERINVKDYGALCDATTNDSTAINAAIDRVITLLSAGTYAVLYIPPGACRYVTAHATMLWPVSIVGDGHMKSVIKVDTALSGDVFSWSDVWQGTSSAWPTSGNTVTLATQTVGVTLSGFSVIGDRSTSNTQNAFVFYDHADQVQISNVTVAYLKGRALYSGVTLNDAEAYMRESRIDNFRVFNSGATNVPVIEFNTIGSGDASNEIIINGLDMFSPYWTGLWIRNANTSKAVQDFRISNLRIEQNSALAIAADNWLIGDTTENGAVANIFANNVELLNPPTGQAALHLTATGSTGQPYFINVARGLIGGGAADGKGLVIDYGRFCNFFLSDIHTTSTNVTIGATSNAGRGIVIDGGGQEQNWTYSINGSFTGGFRSGQVGRYNDPSGNTAGFVAATMPDGTAVGGNTRGGASVDLQINRSAATQIASAAQSTIVGGQQNSATAGWATIPGGFNNVADGQYSVVMGGSATGRTRYGAVVHSSSDITTRGDAQESVQLFRGSGASASAFQLTADGNAASSINCQNIPNSTAYAITVDIVALDHTAVSKNETWNLWPGLLTRGANAAATALVMGATPVALTNGTVTGSAIAATADTTNGCLNISFTPPTGNTDTWNVVARVQAVEVQ